MRKLFLLFPFATLAMLCTLTLFAVPVSAGTTLNSVMTITPLILTEASADVTGQPATEKSSWGRIKVLYRGSEATTNALTQDSTSEARMGRSGVGLFSSSGFAPQYCTWYAASEFDKVAPYPGCNWGGNAGTWIENASAKGWKTYSYPAYPPTSAGYLSMPNGTIVVWKNGGAGHVAVLRSVVQNGIYIQEKNWPVGSGVSPWRYLSWSQVVTRGLDGSYHLSGYIPPWR